MSIDQTMAGQYGTSQSYAPSDGQKGNPYAPFLGELQTMPSQGPGRDLYRRNDDLPQYYADGRRNYFLQDVLEGMVAIDNGWPTTICLPLTFTNQLNVEWDVLTFDQPLVGRVQHEGVSRIVRHARSKRSAQTERRGIALFMEVNFVAPRATKLKPTNAPRSSTTFTTRPREFATLAFRCARFA